MAETFETKLYSKENLFCRSLMEYENEVVTILLIDAHNSMTTLARAAQDRDIITLELFNNLDTLDPSVPYKLRFGYLMLQVYKRITTKSIFRDWLEALNMVKGTGSVVSLVRQFYDSLADSCEQTKTSQLLHTANKNHVLLNEFHVPVLAEILAGCSSRWKEIATVIRLSGNKIENISRMNCTPEIALKEVFSAWILGECERTKLTTLQSLEDALNSEFVGRGKEASELRTKFEASLVVQQKSNASSKSVDPLKYNGNQLQKDQIFAQQGNTTLLQVQIKTSSAPKKYRWFKKVNGRWITLNGSKYYSGTDESILCVSAKDLTLSGLYKCGVSCIDDSSASRPICLTVRTSLDEHQQFLIDRYTALPTMPQDTWPPVHTGTYINLALIKQESIQRAGEYGRGTLRGGMDDILKDKESITYNEAMANLSSGARLFIEGRPGSGKTTFVHKFVLDWAKMNQMINDVRLLFLIQLRGFASDPNIGLRDIIGYYYRDHPGMEDILMYAIKNNGLGLCFVLDGLDEYFPQQKDAFIFELIRRRALPKAVVIVASRPAAVAEFRTLATRQVEVLGFLRAQIYDYIDKYPFATECKESLWKYLEKHPNIMNMCYLPIHASMICFLYSKISSGLPETETDIYSKFTTYAILRILYRTESKITMESLEDLSPSRKEQYLQICKLALTMTMSSKQVVHQRDVSILSTTGEENNLLGLITVDNENTICGNQDLYSFLHLTFQEFLAAYYISSLEEDEQIELIKEHGNSTQMKQVWRFYCGRLRSDLYGRRFKTFTDQSQHGQLFNIHCSFESQQPRTCDSVVKDGSLKFTDSVLTTSDFTAMAFVICNTQQHCVKKVVLDKCTIGIDGVDTLVKKACERLSLVTVLCYHGHHCTSNQLSTVIRLVYWLSGLRILDITNTNLKGIPRDPIKDLNHYTLEIVKVSSTNMSSELADTLASSFISGCHNFVNVCFSGIKMESFSLYCNCKDINLSFHTLTRSELEVLSDDLMKNSDVTTRLSLINCGIDDIAVSCLAQGIKHCTALKILELSCNSIGDEGATVLASESIFSHKLQTLDLCCNRIGDKGAVALALSAASTLGFKLFLWDNLVSNSKKILSLPHANFQTFQVLDRSIKDSNAVSLQSTVVKSKPSQHLRILKFTGCCISLEGIKSLKVILDYCSRNLLSFSFKLGSVSDAHQDLIVSGIITALEHCRSLQSLTIEVGKDSIIPLNNLLGRHKKSFEKLDISKSNVSDEGSVLVLAKALQSCQIRSVNISSCNIGEAGATSLKFNSKIRELDLSSNGIESSGAIPLAKSLACCTNLTLLDISRNNIDSNGAQALCNILVHCRGLDKLAIDHNNIGERGAGGLVKALKRCTNLTSLHISHNNIGTGGAKDLVGALKRCTKLRILDISYNNIHGSIFSHSLKYWKNIEELDNAGNHS